MKKIQKLLLSAFLSISLIFASFVFSMPVYAVGDSWTGLQKYTYFQDHFDEINSRLNGVIINQNHLEDSFEDFLSEYRANNDISGSNEDFINNNTSIAYQDGTSGNADIQISQTLREVMREWCDTYVNSLGFKYVFSTQTASYVSKFNDQDQYHAWLNLINEYDSTTSIVLQPDNYWSTTYVISPNEGKKLDFVYYAGPTYGAYEALIYSNWQSSSVAGSYKVYTYNSTSKTYEVSSQGTGFNPNSCKLKTKPSQISYGNCPVHLNTTQYIMYMTYDSMRNASEGIQDYYVVSDSYNKTISGSYNTTTNSVNTTLSSNDINNYINNYYVENGSYPSTQDVNVFITNNIDNGGGSGGDNGGGSGSDNGESGNDNNFNWGFLGTIGDFIGGLLDAISGIVSGILSALTGIIDLFIGAENPETGQREGGLPNIVGNLIQYFLPFLPPEFLTLIELSLILGLVLGIIRLIRGH